MKRREFLQHTAGFSVLAAGLNAASNSSATPKLKAAIIGDTGRGNYGHGIDMIFDGRPNIEVVALSDPNEAGRTKAQTRTKAPRTYADYHEMIERERPDLVAIGPRWSDRHHAMASAALKAGAHVYTEKPFTPTLAEADSLIALADAKGRKIAVAHPTRIAPSTLHLKRRLEEGLIGELIEIRLIGKQDKRAGGEDLVVLGDHQMDLVRFFAGEPEWCSARVLHQGRDITLADAREPAADKIGLVAGDEIQAMFALPRGVNVHYTSRRKFAQVAGPFGVTFVGTKGEARLVNGYYPPLFQRTDGPWRPLENDPTASAPESERDQTAGNRRIVDDWLAAIAENREPVCSGREAMKTLEMIHAIFAAGLSGTRVKLPLKNRQHPLLG